MAKKLGVISRKTMEKLEQFDYGDLYSIHRGSLSSLYWEEYVEGDAVEIYIGVNRYARLYIIAEIAHGAYSRTFDFDQLDKAVDWVKRHVEVMG